MRADSLEAWAAQYDGMEPEDFTDAQLEEFEALRWGGLAHIVLPDGTRWVTNEALGFNFNCCPENRFLRRLHALFMEHHVLAEHEWRSDVLVFPVDTLDWRHVFCSKCRAWRDLQSDAEEIDRTAEPWPDYEGEEEVDEHTITPEEIVQEADDGQEVTAKGDESLKPQANELVHTFRVVEAMGLLPDTRSVLSAVGDPTLTWYGGQSSEEEEEAEAN